MQTTKVILTVLLSLLPMITIANPETSITMVASIKQPLCYEGQPMILALALHNSGNKTAIGGSAYKESSFQITVTEGAGQSVPHTTFGNRVLTPWMRADNNSPVFLNTDQTLTYRFNLAHLFDLSRAGVYSVTVTLSLFLGTCLTTDPLKFRLVEDAVSKTGPMPFKTLPEHHTFLYLANQDYRSSGSSICRFQVEKDGRISPTLDPLPLGGKGDNSITATPDGHFLYVSNDNEKTISQFQINTDGQLSPLSPPAVPAQYIPQFLIIDPKGRFLFALGGHGNTRYAIGRDGRLTFIAAVSPEEWTKDNNHNIEPVNYAVIVPTGNFLFADNRQGYRIGTKGQITVLAKPNGRPVSPKGEVDQTIALSPLGQFAFILTTLYTFVKSDYTQADDVILPMRVGTDGSLTPVSGAQTLRGSKAVPDFSTSLKVDPTGHFLLAISPTSITRYQIGLEGSLTLLGVTPQNGQITSIIFSSGSHRGFALNRNPSSLRAFHLDTRANLISEGVEMPENEVPFSDSLAAVEALTPQKWGTAAGGLKICAHLERDVLPVGTPAVLTVVLKNITSHSIGLGVAGTDIASFRLSLLKMHQLSDAPELRDEPALKAVSLLAAGRELLDLPGTSTTPLLLPPGSQRQYQFILSRLSDLSVSGKYTVIITRILPSGAIATSPPVNFFLDGSYDGLIYEGQELYVL